MGETVIAVQNVCKSFKSHLVLNDITLNFEKGKIYGFVGRNGSGKTVLLKCICGLMKPTSGKVFIYGREIGKDIEFADNIGFIIENPGFLMHESGLNNLKHLASIRKRVSISHICDTMEMVGLDPWLKKNVGRYSLGMKQKLGLAQALMEDPDILILDEPMNGLDDQTTAQVRKMLLHIRDEGKTIILASHAREDIAILCSKTFKIDAGIVECIDTPPVDQ